MVFLARDTEILILIKQKSCSILGTTRGLITNSLPKLVLKASAYAFTTLSE